VSPHTPLRSAALLQLAQHFTALCSARQQKSSALRGLPAAFPAACADMPETTYSASSVSTGFSLQR